MAKLRPATSAQAADWIRDETHGFAESVASLLPDRYEAYARVFHPAGRGVDDEEEVRWAQIAGSTNRRFHPAAQWPHIAFTEEIHNINDAYRSGESLVWDSAPEEGSLDEELARRLIRVLSPRTSTPQHCWFAVWEGWGGLSSDALKAPRFELPGRAYFLFEGPIEAAAESFWPDFQFQSASLWWPDDRAWCLATEVDFQSTYIGGSHACVQAVVSDETLEALEVELGQGVDWASDTINPNPLRLS